MAQTMYDQTELELGQQVKDRISGFEGIINTIGFHISGCIRIGVIHLGEEDASPSRVSSEEFFYPQQLDITEESTEWTELDPKTDVDYTTGQTATNEADGFRGRITVINFMLFNCPQVLLREKGGDYDSSWVDDPFVDAKRGETLQTPGFDDDPQSTGPAEDSPSRELSSSL